MINYAVRFDFLRPDLVRNILALFATRNLEIIDKLHADSGEQLLVSQTQIENGRF